MHELGVVEGIREIALSHARSAGASRILSVRVAIAKSSRYLEDALAMFWDEVCGLRKPPARRSSLSMSLGSGCVWHARRASRAAEKSADVPSVAANG